MPVKQTTQNYFFKYILRTWHLNRRNKNKDGDEVVVKIYAGGGGRAGKTWDIAQAIWVIGTHYADKRNAGAKPLYIAVYRNVSADCKKRTLEDFLGAYRSMGLEQGKDFDVVGQNGGNRTLITFLGHKIEFMGVPEAGIQPTKSDITFINEAVECKNKGSVELIVSKTQMLFIADWNPSASDHFIYNYKGRFNTFYPVITYLDNKHLPQGQKAEYESKCPWDFKDSVLEYDLETAQYDEEGNLVDGFVRRIWLKPERPEVCKEVDYHLYRADNEENKAVGSIDKFSYLVYAEGKVSSLDGAVFREYKWVNKFPEEGYDSVNFGLDFGYMSDSTALTRNGIMGRDAYIEGLTYQITPTPDICFDAIEPHILNEWKRRNVEFNGQEWADKLEALQLKLQATIYNKIICSDYEQKARLQDEVDKVRTEILTHKESGYPLARINIVCDTADKFKEMQFVHDLNSLARTKGYDWDFVKVGGKPIVEGIALMKRFNLHFVKNPNLEKELNNYIYATNAAGEPTNMPDPDSKFNHYIDSARYCFWKMWRHAINTINRF